MKTSVNNFALIKDILKWEKEGDYYYVQLFLRKKDQTTTFGNKNNSARLIRTYNFFTLEQFLSKEEEIIKICELFKCRAGINLNIRNEREVAYELLRNLSDRLASGNYKGINGILNTTNGSVVSKDKLWLIDCDNDSEFETVQRILNDSRIRPEGNKIIVTLPTYSGYHIITNRFDRQTFDDLLHRQEQIHTVEIHKNNPVALYYPNQEN